MTRESRRYQFERQPLLEFTDTAKEINRKDLQRETRIPEQLELLKGPQQELFPALGMPGK
jgi:hypothetical protein